MARFGLSLGLSAREPILRIAEIARKGEAYGFDVLWLTDSHLAMKDVYVALTVAAQATRRIKLGTGVTNPVTRHITHTVTSISALDEVSDGRAILGIGPGDSAVYTIGLRPATVAQTRKAVQSIRTLMAGGELVEADHPYQVRPARRVPLFISASQPRLLMLAGEVADGVILMGGANTDITQWQLGWIARGAREGGRSLDDVFIDLWFAISLQEDQRQAYQDVRAWVSSQARWFHGWKELPDALKPFREEFARAHGQYHFLDHLSRHASHGSAVSDQLCELIAVAGPVDHAAQRIRELLALKVDRITLALLPGGRMERLRRLGEELVPLFHGQ